jgi:hypothetical protein
MLGGVAQECRKDKDYAWSRVRPLYAGNEGSAHRYTRGLPFCGKWEPRDKFAIQKRGNE